MNSMFAVDLRYKEKCWDLLRTLFPIYRTLMGDGFRESLNVIREFIPIMVKRFPSGEGCGSWTIPQEWRVQKAVLSDSNGNVIADFASDAFCLWQYSSSFTGWVELPELLDHVSTCPDCEDAVPLNVTYYRKNWGFSIAETVKREKLRSGRFYVDIRTEFKEGYLEVGELYIEGGKTEEIVLDAVLSCASLANNLSGVAIAAVLGCLLSERAKPLYSYRILFTPETLGPICLHYQQENFGANVVGGYTLGNLGDSKEFHYKLSRPGNTPADLALCHSLRHFGRAYSVEEYDVRSGACGNEKAYNSLGIEIPVGAFRRSPLGSYCEYDTSKDNLEFVNSDSIFESLQVLWGAIMTLERNRTYDRLFEGEPFLTGYGLFPKIQRIEDRLPYDYLMGFVGKDASLMAIADKAGIPISCFDEAASLMVEKGLIKEVSKGNA